MGGVLLATAVASKDATKNNTTLQYNSKLYDDSTYEIARLPVPEDNAAIALYDLKAGTRIRNNDTSFELQHDILTGHRFAATLIKAGSFITSWAYSFGTASRDIEAGEYLCNRNVLFRLSIQEDPQFTTLKLTEANFNDDIDVYSFDRSSWQKPTPVEQYKRSSHLPRL